MAAKASTTGDDDLQMNFADVEEGGAFTLLPNGKYHAMVTGFEVTETEGGKAPGTPMVKAEYTIASGKYENRRVWDNLVLNKDSLWKVKQFLLGTGLSKEEVDSMSARAFLDKAENEEFMEIELDVRVGRQAATQEYDARNKVNGYAVHKKTEADLLP